MGCRGLPRPRVPRLVRLNLVHKESHQYVDVVRTLVECDLAQAQARDSNIATFESACDQGSRPPRRRRPPGPSASSLIEPAWNPTSRQGPVALGLRAGSRPWGRGARKVRVRFAY